MEFSETTTTDWRGTLWRS